MSDQPLDPPTTPSSRWLSNNDGHKSTGSRSSSELAGESSAEVKDVARHAEAIQQDAQQESYLPPAHYPIDENLFSSAPSNQSVAHIRSDPSSIHPPPREPEEDEQQQRQEEEQTYDDPWTEAPLLPPPNFRPFFPIIDDPSTGEHHHPTVHYAFADDDPDLVTAFALDAIDSHRSPGHVRKRDDVEERVVIVDLAADGRTVLRAASMSPHWQAVKAEITRAPSWGDKSAEGDTGLMLRVEGGEVRSAPAKAGKGKAPLPRRGDVEELVRTFGERLDRLEDVVGKSLIGSSGGEGDVG